MHWNKTLRHLAWLCVPVNTVGIVCVLESLWEGIKKYTNAKYGLLLNIVWELTWYVFWQFSDPVASLPLLLFLRCVKSCSGHWRAGQQPLQSGEPCQDCFCFDGSWTSRTAAEAPHQSHLPPWPLLLHPCGQGNQSGFTSTSLWHLASSVHSWLKCVALSSKAANQLALLALWGLNLSHGPHSVVKRISLDRAKCGYS